MGGNSKAVKSENFWRAIHLSKRLLEIVKERVNTLLWKEFSTSVWFLPRPVMTAKISESSV